VNFDRDVVIPMDAETLGFWLKAFFGHPVTTGTTPRTHTFQSGGFTLPSMAMETQMPDVPRFAMYSGLVADRIQWQSQRSGLLTATVGLIGRGETVAATTAAGVLTDATLPLQRFGNFQGSITRNGAALGNIVSAQVTYANNLDRIETRRPARPTDRAHQGRTEHQAACCNRRQRPSSEVLHDRRPGQ
jgi:hypothetical protein